MNWWRRLWGTPAPPSPPAAEPEPPPAFAFLDPGPLRDGDLVLALVDRQPGNARAGEVPCYSFAMQVHGETYAGRLALRIGDTPRLRLYAGHIGYFVEPEHRGHHYASRSVRLVLPLAWRHGLDPVWITCNPDNPASRRGIERAGGVYVETVPVPPDDPLALAGDVQKCRFRFDRPREGKAAGAANAERGTRNAEDGI